MVPGAVFAPSALCGSTRKPPEPARACRSTDTRCDPITAISSPTIHNQTRRFTQSLPLQEDANSHFSPNRTHPRGAFLRMHTRLPRDIPKEGAGFGYLPNGRGASLRRQSRMPRQARSVPLRTDNRINEARHGIRLELNEIAQCTLHHHK